MVEIRKAHLDVLDATLTNIGSGLFVIPFATSDVFQKLISLLGAIMLLGFAVYIKDLKEKIYD